MHWACSEQITKAYIPLRRKTIRIVCWRWLGPPMPQFCVTCTNMLVSKYTKNLRYPQCKFENLRHPMQNPNASQWNIGCVGFQTQKSCVGHVPFMFFVLISFAFGGQRKPSFQWNMGLSVNHIFFRGEVNQLTECGTCAESHMISQRYLFSTLVPKPRFSENLESFVFMRNLSVSEVLYDISFWRSLPCTRQVAEMSNVLAKSCCKYATISKRDSELICYMMLEIAAVHWACNEPITKCKP